jgi:hypothetical protein
VDGLTIAKPRQAEASILSYHVTFTFSFTADGISSSANLPK